MKSKLLIVATLCAIGLSASAQTEKGKNFINGSIGFETNKAKSSFSNSQKSNSFNVMPRYGYFVSSNMAIGLGLGYFQGKNTQESFNFDPSYSIYSISVSKYHTFSISPFVRRYVDIAEKFKFFGELNLGIGFGKQNNELTANYSGTPSFTETTYKFTTYNASLAPGFAFFPSKRWAIEFSFPLISYTKTKPKDQTSGISVPNNETFSFATNSFNPSIGFNFHF